MKCNAADKGETPGSPCILNFSRGLVIPEPTVGEGDDEDESKGEDDKKEVNDIGEDLNGLD